LVKNENFWPIVGDGICPKLSFGLFSVTMDHKFVLNVKKSAENGQFTMKVIKKTSLWAISRKAPYRIFFNMPFWKVPRVPRNTSSLVFFVALLLENSPYKTTKVMENEAPCAVQPLMPFSIATVFENNLILNEF
jgi:hypothetical protein